MPVLTWDATDIDELVRRFSVPELRAEVHHAELEIDIARFYERSEFDDGRLGFWEAYLDTIRLALDIAHSQQPKLQPVKAKLDAEAVKGRADIVSVIEGYTQLKKSGSRYTGKCPIHHDTAPSLVVYPDKQSWHCFGACNTGGDVIAFVMKAENLDFKEALARLGGGL